MSQAPPNLPSFTLSIPPNTPAKPSITIPMDPAARFIANFPILPKTLNIFSNFFKLFSSANHLSKAREMNAFAIKAIMFSNGFKNFSNHENIPFFFPLSLSSFPAASSAAFVFGPPPSASSSASWSFSNCNVLSNLCWIPNIVSI